MIESLDRVTLQEYLDSTILNARDIIRSGVTNEELKRLSVEVQQDICEVHRSEIAMVKSRGTCSGNCTNDCLVTSHRGESVCRWTYQTCPTRKIQNLLDLFSIVNHRGEVLCQPR